MRRLIALTLLATIAFTACKRRPDDAPPEVPADLLPAFEVADPRATVQMTRGFYALEGNSWRWTAPEFSVILARPLERAAGGSLHVELKFNIPDVVFTQTGALTITASTPGATLPPQTFSTAGDHTFAADFTPSGDAVAIDFKVDKHINPGGDDNRDLAIIASSIGLTAK